MRALGVAPLAAHLAGELRRSRRRSPPAKAETRQYAKRQRDVAAAQYDCVEIHQAQQMERIVADTFHLLKLSG